MESMTSIAPRVRSTIAIGLEDDANNFSMVFFLLYLLMFICACHLT